MVLKKLLNKKKNKSKVYEDYKNDFPIFKNEPSLIYLDSACVTLRPKCVINKINEYYEKYSACAGRSSHYLAKKVNKEIEISRQKIKNYLNANSIEEIIFIRNTTEGINLISNSLKFKKDEYVITTDKEHNSNLLPWIILKEKGVIKLNIIKTESGNINLKELEEKLSDNNVKLISINYASNLDGLINPVKEIIKIAHKYNTLVLLDGAQAGGHIKIDVKKLDIDFLVLSGHKMFGPSGIGILYIKKKLLKDLNPFIIGGDTVSDVFYPNYQLLDSPNKYEAGLQNYSGIIGMGAAIDYLSKNINFIENNTQKLLELLFSELERLDLEIISKKENNSGIFTFIPKKIDSYELGEILSANKICVRVGAFCVHNWFNKHKKGSAVRISLNIYNNIEDIKKTIKIIKEFC